MSGLLQWVCVITHSLCFFSILTYRRMSTPFVVTYSLVAYVVMVAHICAAVHSVFDSGNIIISVIGTILAPIYMANGGCIRRVIGR